MTASMRWINNCYKSALTFDSQIMEIFLREIIARGYKLNVAGFVREWGRYYEMKNILLLPIIQQVH